MSLLSIGTSGLITAQTSLSTTSHNISNINTDGFIRQRTQNVTQTPEFRGGFFVGSRCAHSVIRNVH